MTLSCKLTGLLLLLVPFSSGTSSAQTIDKPVFVSSPDRKIQVQVLSQVGTLRYSVTVDGAQVLQPSVIGMLSDGKEIGYDVTIDRVIPRSVHQQYKFFGAHATAENNANEAEIDATSQGEHVFVDVHVANDGVAVRLRLPAKAGRKVLADRSSWKFGGDPQMWVADWDPGYEKTYRTTSLRQLGTGQLGLPITAHVGNVYMTLTEAALKDYGDLGIVPMADGTIQGQLFNDPDGWVTDAAVVQPWRVTVLARDLTTLVNSTLVQNLNDPPRPDLVDADWIRPGRSSWQWLATGDPKQDEQTQWVDWTQQLGFEYYLIDEGWSKWTDPWGSIANVSAYARKQNVKIWIWVHSREVQDPAARKVYFQRAVAAGVVGVKIDFPPPTNRALSNWYWDTARDAAEYHLMVDFHGATKPTGMERTWPNAITREGIRGHEYHITRYKRRLDDAHDVILPFTRYIAGPADYTPTVFTPEELQGNTWGHELAQAIVFTSPYLCFGGHPESYLQNPAKDVIEAIPAVWDETKVLPGSEPGKVVAEARRSGDTWFVAVMNGGEPGNLDLPLDFLGKGDWHAIELFDQGSRPDAWRRVEIQAGGASHISLQLGSRGGFVAEFKSGHGQQQQGGAVAAPTP